MLSGASTVARWHSVRLRRFNRTASAFTWLGQGLTQTVTSKGRLRPNLHALQEEDWIIFAGSRNEEALPQRLLRQKHEVFTSEARGNHLIHTEESIPAQTEVLEMLLEHLPNRFPHHFRVVPDSMTGRGKPELDSRTTVAVSVGDLHAEYRVSDFLACPLELASRLVLEDLVLVKDGVVCAGSVMFSFSRFRDRFGMDMEEIHRKVPQYARDLQKPVNRVFASLTPERPLYRSNWNISWSNDVMAGYSRYPHRNPGISIKQRQICLHGLKEAIQAHGLADTAWLKVEYQTLRRLRRNPSYILFTVRTFLDSFGDLEAEPLAAKALLNNLNQLHGNEFTKYLGIDDVGIYTLVKQFVENASST
mmetsp:Transcript_44714/g.104174  ORF Transcript_44714/g.104174 Transcript_44714/m.104174 type:complete len:362 (-) Transcript_44714:76-1161(-)